MWDSSSERFEKVWDDEDVNGGEFVLQKGHSLLKSLIDGEEEEEDREAGTFVFWVSNEAVLVWTSVGDNDDLLVGEEAFILDAVVVVVVGISKFALEFVSELADNDEEDEVEDDDDEDEDETERDEPVVVVVVVFVILMMPFRSRALVFWNQTWTTRFLRRTLINNK